MKVITFKSILLAAALLLSIQMWAYDFSAVCSTGQTLYYKINGSSLTVTYPATQEHPYLNFPSPSGDMVIPPSILYNGTTYPVTAIGDYAFYYCSGLTSVTIPNSVISIGNHSFDSCIQLYSVDIPNSVTSIGIDAFDFTDLTSITIPYSVTSIGAGAFGGSMLTSVNYTGTLSQWCGIDFGSYTANPCYSAQSLSINGTPVTGDLVIPSDVTKVKSYTFEYLTGLTSITITDSVTSIGNNAFAYCTGVTSLEIGSSVASIGAYAFNCPYISSITVHRMTPPTIDYTTFSGIDPSIPVHIPCSSLFTYQTMAFWFNFTNYQEGEFGYIFSVTSNDTVKGYVSVLAPPDCSNPQAFIQAVSNPGYTFTHWSDGSTDNPRTIVVTQDIFLIAIFESLDGMGENKPETVSVYPNPAEGTFTIEAENIIGVEIFDLAGQKVLTDRSGNQTISAGNLTTGVYFLKVETRNGTKYGKLIKK